MSKFIIITALVLLSACGGGDPTVNCNVPEACILNAPVTINVDGGVTVTGALIPERAASAPAPAASVPAVVPVPLGAPVDADVNGLIVPAGNIQWVSDGIVYAVVFRDFSGFMFSMVISASDPQNPKWVGNGTLDDGFDLHMPASDDASLKAYLETWMLPQLNKFLSDNFYLFTNGMVFAPVSNSPVSTSLPPLRRVAALTPQWIQIKLVNGVPVASFK